MESNSELDLLKIENNNLKEEIKLLNNRIHTLETINNILQRDIENYSNIFDEVLTDENGEH